MLLSWVLPFSDQTYFCSLVPFIHIFNVLIWKSKSCLGFLNLSCISCLSQPAGPLSPSLHCGATFSFHSCANIFITFIMTLLDAWLYIENQCKILQLSLVALHYLSWPSSFTWVFISPSDCSWGSCLNKHKLCSLLSLSAVSIPRLGNSFPVYYPTVTIHPTL